MNVKYWLTPEGSFDMAGTEHTFFAMGIMLQLPTWRKVPPFWWTKGIPKHEIEAAIKRGVSDAALSWLEQKKDTRLYMIQNYGWVRTAKKTWDLWEFDSATAAMIRNDNPGYWKDPTVKQMDEVKVLEWKTGDEFAISVERFLAGARPSVLRKLSSYSEGEVDVTPASYSTAKYSEMERSRLYGRTGGN